MPISIPIFGSNPFNKSKKEAEAKRAALERIDPEQLGSWSETLIPYYPTVVEAKESKFPTNHTCNSKITLWEGDITTLAADAIVHSTTESLISRSSESEKLLTLGGPELVDECQRMGGCRTGESKITSGYRLFAKNVIHTVGPRYNAKYRTAAESALFNCYRSSLQLLRENNLKTLGLCPINSPKRGYPADQGAHIAIRAVRRFLEKHGSNIDLIVFVVGQADRAVYEQLLPLYFPRCFEEEQWAIDELPSDTGNEDGEPIIEERQIRINLIRPKSAHNIYEYESVAELPVARKSFSAITAMQGDHDASRLQSLGQRKEKEREQMDALSRYQAFVRRSRSECYKDLAALRMCYVSGTDFLGRPVIVFVGKHFPAKNVDLDRALSYLVCLLDHVVDQPYVVAYFHTGSSDDNQPELSWLRKVYQFLPMKYRKNLHRVFIVHPTRWSRLVTWFFTTFTASNIKDRVVSLPTVGHLYNYVGRDQLHIPDFIAAFDRTTHMVPSHNDDNAEL
eukprot:Colp12_sorted_trinity150504_noHs@6373